MTEVVSKKIPINSCDIHFLEAGNKDRQSVILLHGMKFQAATWQQTGTMQKLAEAGFHAIAIDMPGFGKSPACSIDKETVLQHFISNNEPHVVLVGPSMGGRIALEFAINHSGSINGLVLVGSVGVQENKKRLPEISASTLIVWGSEDQISSMANCELLHASIQGSIKIIIEGAPHPCYLDNSEIWHRELIHFLNTAKS